MRFTTHHHACNCREQKFKDIIDKVNIKVEGITCLCAEGPEFHSKLELMDLIAQEACKVLTILKEWE